MSQWKSNFQSPSALARFFGVTIGGVALDLWIKWLAFSRLVQGRDSLRWIPGWLQIDVTRNHGAVFGIGQGRRTVFLFISVLAIAFLVYLFATSGRRRTYQIVLGMLLAGVLGNMYDRIVFGYVRDMIHALPGRTWPVPVQHILPASIPAEIFPWVFNVADMLLCTGVGMMLLLSFFGATHETGDKAMATGETPSDKSVVNPQTH